MMSKILLLLKELSKILDLELFLVGGRVRDDLLAKVSLDLDFTTAADPEVVESKIIKSGFKPFSIGKKFGTIAFKYEKYEVQITTFRTEKYIDSRKPEVVFVKSLDEDLARRDFTINAIAVDQNGKFHDLFGGLEDLKLGLIKSVGEGKKRFKEDPLRMLRAVRLATVLNFQIEEQTYKSIIENYHLLCTVSKERWVLEIDKILSCENVVYGLNLLQKTNLMRILIPELTLQVGFNQNSIYHDFRLWRHTTNVVSNVPKENLELRWAALLHDVAKPFVQTRNYKKGICHYLNHHILGADLCEMICKRLKFSGSRTKFISDIVLHHLEPDNVLKIFDDAGKKLPINYIKPQVVVVNGGEAFVDYQKYIEWLKEDQIYTSKNSETRFWTSNLAADLDSEFEVIKFEMPNKMNSHYLEWKIQFEKQYKVLDFNRPIILVGWSLGALFLVKWLCQSEESKSNSTRFISEGKIPSNIINQLHLVAAPLSEGDFTIPQDFKNIPISCKKVFIYHSINDEIVPFESAQKYLKMFDSHNAVLIQNPNQGHFLIDRIDQLLENIKA